MEGYETSVRKLALVNAVRHDGKARLGPTVSAVLAERPEFRERAKELYRLAAHIIDEINELTIEQQRQELDRNWPELLAKKPEEQPEKKLPPLPNANRYPIIRTRFAPNPDGPLTLGHARPVILCSEYAEAFHGRFILRFEDTSPEVKAPIDDAYEWIIDDLAWLGARPDEVYYQSDRLGIYYEYAEKLISSGSAYVCTCRPEMFRELYFGGEACPCRDQGPTLHLERWRMMLDGRYRAKEAVLRVKTDLGHPNPAVRDWPALRISGAKHPRAQAKYRVWPLYNFSCAVDDHLMEITHIIRGKEHETNTIRQRYLFKHFGWEYPETISVGRLGLETGILSKSRIRSGIQKGMYTGWDDPRLGTLVALKRRGLQPEAIRKLILEVGSKPVNATLTWSNIASANKAFVDPTSKRFYFVADPVPLTVKNIPHVFQAKLPLHPDRPEWGTRQYEIAPMDGQAAFVISDSDSALLKEDKLIRLIGLFNISKSSSHDSRIAEYLSEPYADARAIGAPLIHWLPRETGIKTKVMMPDGSTTRGVAESACRDLDTETVVQFERFGFVRLDKIEEDCLSFYYAHR